MLWNLVVAICAVATPALASAQVVRAFTPRFTANNTGDVSVIGNTLLTCPSSDSNCAAAQNGTGGTLNNNDFVMEYVDIDGDVSTFNSSAADLSLPAGGTVLFAGLYWGAQSTDAARYMVNFATPASGGYLGLTATQQDVDAANERYSGFVDVTALVQSAGSGTYTVANVQAQAGQTNRYAGWALIVVIQDAAAPLRSLVVFDGYAQVTTTLPSVDIPVTGLLTPPSGPVNTRMGAVSYEGDLNLLGDELQLNGTAVGDAANPTTNFFNSTISRLGAHITAKTPNYQNQLGYDADVVDVTPFGALANGATGATITLTTSGDWYWPAAVTFVTDLFEPVIQPNFNKAVLDVNGGVVQPGDTLEYSILVRNSGNDAATDVILADTIPSWTSYAAGTIDIVSGANAGVKSDPSGDDQAEFDAAVGPNGRIVVRLGTGADATSGGTLGPGEQTELSFRVVVDSSAADGTTVSNRAGLDYGGATLGTTFNSQSNQVDVNIVSQADLSVTKDDGTATINQGDVITYTIQATNAGPMPVTGAVVTDLFPTELGGVTWTCVASAGSSCPASGNGNMNVSVDLLASGTATFSATGTVLGTGTLSNTASVTTPAGITDPNPGNDSATDLDTQVTPTADMVTTKSGPAVVAASATFSYTVVARNAGLSAAPSVVVTDTLPPAATFVSVTGAGTEANGVVTWPTLASLPAGDSVVYDVTVQAPPAGTLTNVVASTSSILDPDPSNNDGSQAGGRVTTLVTENADIVATKTGPSNIDVGQTLDYTITIRNNGPSTASNVVLTDTLPANVTLVAASGGATEANGVVTWPTIASLPVGGSATYTVSAMPAGIGMYTNVVSATASTPDPTPGNNDGSDPAARVVTAVQGAPDVAITQQQPANFIVGMQGTFDLTVVNEGRLPTAGDIVIADTLPSGLTFVSGAGAAWTVSAAGQVVTATRAAPLLPNDTTIVTLTVGVGSGAAPNVMNTARVSTAGDTNPINDVSTDQFAVNQVDLSIVKAGVGDFIVGDNGVFTITVTNIGDVATMGTVAVTDSLVDGLTFVSGTGPGWTVGATGQVVTATNAGPLGPGESSDLTLTVVIGPEALPSVINRAVVATPGDSAGGGNNVAVTSPIEVKPPSELFLEKTSSRGFVDIAEVLGYTVRVQNVGTRPLPGVIVDDLLPAGFKYLTGTARLDGSTIADPSGAPGPSLTFAIDTIQPGATLSLTYQVAIGPGVALGDGINRAQASSPTTGAVSNEAAAAVRLRTSAFTDQGYIIGKVFAQCACLDDQLQDDEELGIPGVRVFLQNGMSTVTDVEGKYNFVGLSPRLYVVRVDETSLPAGARLVPLTNRNARDGNSLLADLTSGELQRADFATGASGATFIQEVKARRRAGEVSAAILDSVPTFDAVVRSGDRHRPSDTPFTPVLPRTTLSDGNSLLPLAPGENGMRWPAPGDPEPRLVVDVPVDAVPADGATPIPVRVAVAETEPSSADTVMLTLEATNGEWLVNDANDSLPGVQTPLSGDRVFYLRAPADPGDVLVRATQSAETSATGTIAFAPPERPLLVSGLLEGRFDLRSLANGSLLPGRVRDRFQDELEALAVEGSDGRVNAAARGAVFATGTVADEALVTFRFDTERDPEQTMFRDIRPDEFYPVYGDASIKGFDAQARSRLYARVDRGLSYFLYGDYNTAVTPQSARTLGAYDRSLTGALQHFETRRWFANAFASKDRQRQIVDELQALGISGPYTLTQADGLINSERVEILTRDRNQPAEILRIEPLTRFTDYTLEPFTGRLILRRPVPSVDEHLNPMSIRIVYEIERGGDKFWVFGVDGGVKPIDRIEIGGSYAQDDDPAGKYEIASANATVDLGANTFVVGEFARSDSAGAATGNGTRLELRHLSPRIDGRLFFLNTDVSFVNPSSGLLSGRTELGFRGRGVIDERTRIVGEAIRTERRLTGGTRRGAQFFVERRVNELINAELGYRYARETAQPAGVRTIGATPNETNAIRAKVTGRLPWVWDASVFGALEQDVVRTSQRRATIGGDVNVLQRARVYAKHEFISSFAGPYALNEEQERNTTVVGIASAYLEGSQVFSEYRVRDALAGREAQAAIGLRNQWTIGPGLRINSSFERVAPMGSSDGSTATAITGGVEYTKNPLWKGTARLEFRASESADNLFGSLGFARKLSRDWSLLGQSIFSVILGGGRSYEHTRIGVAYRETDRNRWNLLARYENRFEKNREVAGVEQSSFSHVFSGHADYHPSQPLLVRGQLAAKFSNESFDDTTTKLEAYLLGLRGTYDLTPRWDVGLITRTLTDGGFESVQYGLGAEAGFLLIHNLRVAAGFNVFGFDANDMAEANNTDRGFYIDVQFKFDEGLFGELVR